MNYPIKRTSLKKFESAIFKPDDSKFIRPKENINGDLSIPIDYFEYGTYVIGTVKDDKTLVIQQYHDEKIKSNQFISFIGRDKYYLLRRSLQKRILAHHNN